VLLRLVVEFWWLILPLAGLVVAWRRARSGADEWRPRRDGRALRATTVDVEQNGSGWANQAANHAARRGEITRILDEHNRTDARWLDYEIDVARLLDFPMMTDMRDPLTMAFHKAKLRADLLRPVNVEDLLAERDTLLQYRDAVADYVAAFNVAEAEAIRRRRSDFSPAGQQRLARAQGLLRLASDSAATPQERRQAYDRARKELDGLLVLPAATRAGIERRIAGQIEM
jgi:hypothetical protein